MQGRTRDYAVLIALCAVLTLPNLGAPSLWDVDEGVNAEAAREMRDNDSWLIPTFNYKLRTAKPVMLYWLQRFSFAAFGVSEWSARLPSAILTCCAVLLLYELARRMFDRTTGLLAGVVMASAIEVCLLAHAATPDATLLVFTVLTFYAFWRGHTPAQPEIAHASEGEAGRTLAQPESAHASEGEAGRNDGSNRWWRWTAAACALAMLTKGPVGVALPGLVIFLYFAWNRELSRLLDRRILTAGLLFLLIAGPWYGLVTAETRGEWARQFFGRENMHRFSTPMDNHSGPFFYHSAALLVLFAPWSAFMLAALWCGWRGAQRPVEEAAALPRPERLLLCWFGAYLVFFSAAATKLPNYMLPAYPALAILSARFFMRWRAGEVSVPKWVMSVGVASVALTGLAFAVGLVVVSGVLGLLPETARTFPGAERVAMLGLVPLACAFVLWRALRANDRERFVRAQAVGAVAFTALLAAFGSGPFDARKAAKELVRASGVSSPERDIRLAHHDWFQPSIVFYARREVTEVFGPEAVAEFLAVPTPGYLFVPANTWAQLEQRVKVPVRVAARQYDFYRNKEILVVTNDGAATAAR
jgi:4-amino-4-deoxy-L-arabinose transferase-like glycosyltransferase